MFFNVFRTLEQFQILSLTTPNFNVCHCQFRWKIVDLQVVHHLSMFRWRIHQSFGKGSKLGTLFWKETLLQTSSILYYLAFTELFYPLIFLPKHLKSICIDDSITVSCNQLFYLTSEGHCLDLLLWYQSKEASIQKHTKVRSVVFMDSPIHWFFFLWNITLPGHTATWHAFG